jgi:phage terminase small subunit
MPALPNPRHELFAQALVAGLAGKTRIERAHSTAYLTAYPNCSNGNSAEACASRLLRRAKPIFERVRELQAQAAHDLKETPETIAAELNQIKDEARADKAHAAAVSAILGKAKVLGLVTDKHQDTTPKQSFANARSVNDIAKLMLGQVGVKNPSPLDLNGAIAAHNALLASLQAIAERHGVLELDAD